MRGFGTDGRPLRTQRSRWFSDAARSSISTSPGAGDGIRRVLVPKNFGAAVLVYPDGLHRGTLPGMTASELERLGAEIGLDVVGAARAEPYVETERHIRERRERGLFADMRFTMAQPEVSCHPETLLPDARTVVSAALCYYAPGGEPAPGEGRLPRYTWDDRYAELRAKLEELGRRLGGEYRVLVDANQHVDREGAARAGVGFYGKNTLLITSRFGSWVVLGTLVTDVEIESTPPLDARLRLVPPLHRRLPDGRARRAGHARRDALPLVLDAVAGRRFPRSSARRSRIASTAATSARTSVRGTAASRSGAPDEPARGEPVVSLVEWLTEDGDALRRRYDRLYVPRNDRALPAAERARRRSATPAAPEHLDLARRLRGRRAARAVRRVGARADRGALVLKDVDASPPVRALDRERPRRRRRVRRRPGRRSAPATRRATSARRGSTTAVFAIGAAILFWLSRRDLPRRRQVLLAFVALGFDTALIVRVPAHLQLRERHARSAR